MKTYTSHQVAAEHQGLSVEDYLKQVLNYSGRRIQKLTRVKGILLNKRTVFLQKLVKTGDILQVRILEDLSFGVNPEAGPVEVLYEDKYIVILNKPAGLLVHPTGQTSKGTLSNYLAHYFQQQGVTCTIRPLHRLDRETSGCVVFAKDSQTQTLLEKSLQDGNLKRIYLALVQGTIEPPSGTIDAPIGPHPSKPNRRAVNPKGEPAITHYKTLRLLPGASIVELSLETGRTHQIRVHLAHLGHPVLGDRMYGRSSSLIPGQALHASSVSFQHPVLEQQIRVEAPLPESVVQLIEKLTSDIQI